VRLAVIGAVALHLLRPLARPPALAPDGRDTLDQPQQLRDVVAVRPRQTQRERDATALDQQVVLAAELAPIYRAFAGLLAPRPALTPELSTTARSHESCPSA